MKKCLMMLTVVLAMLLLGGTALAARTCDACGSGDLTLAGSGAWCHWDCDECGYRTSRNHNPNSYNSGLVPDSCSGRCQWCGAAASWSSHTFANYVSNGDAACEVDGTETAVCANEQCYATDTRTMAGSALQHQYMEWVVEPRCKYFGYTMHRCKICGHTYETDGRDPLGHRYEQWSSNGDGTHTAPCIFGDECGTSKALPCTPVTRVVGGVELSLCPVCGYVSRESVSTDLEGSAHAFAEALDGSKLPGTLIVQIDPAPMDIEMRTDAFYMFITSFQNNGEVVEAAGSYRITVDLNENPFLLEDSIFFDMPPSELKARAFKIVRVETEGLNDQNIEVWHEMPFTLKEGVLTFDTDKMGIFLMVLNIMEAPSVG